MASLNEIGGIVYSALIMIGSIRSYSMYICYGNNVMFKRKHFKQLIINMTFFVILKHAVSSEV